MSTTKKCIRSITAALLVGVLLLCALFIVAEGHHDCSGDGCGICACIRLCERVLHPLLEVRSASAAAAVLAPSLLFCLLFLLGPSAAKDSPVSHKVRINE